MVNHDQQQFSWDPIKARIQRGIVEMAMGQRGNISDKISYKEIMIDNEKRRSRQKEHLK